MRQSPCTAPLNMENLFARFKVGIESRKNALADIKEHEDVILAAIGKSGRPSGGRLRKTQAC